MSQITHPAATQMTGLQTCGLALVLANQGRQEQDVQDDDLDESEDRRRPMSPADRLAQKKLEVVTAE